MKKKGKKIIIKKTSYKGFIFMRDGYNKGVKTFPYSLEILNAKKAGQRALLSLLYKEKNPNKKVRNLKN